MILDGELDHLPEAAFNLKGTIEEVIGSWRKDASRSELIWRFDDLAICQLAD